MRWAPRGSSARSISPPGAFDDDRGAWGMVRIYLLLGEPEKALDQLEPLLLVPFYLSPG
ncbi:MAG: hypothetical protein ACHQ2E_03390 [Gemmatimonadales bacterium]